jgi:hypothetical protein
MGAPAAAEPEVVEVVEARVARRWALAGLVTPRSASMMPRSRAAPRFLDRASSAGAAGGREESAATEVLLRARRGQSPGSQAGKGRTVS